MRRAHSASGLQWIFVCLNQDRRGIPGDVKGIFKSIELENPKPADTHRPLALNFAHGISHLNTRPRVPR
jgi:hypothetical protein